MDKESQEYKDYRKRKNETQREYYEKNKLVINEKRKDYNKINNKLYYEKNKQKILDHKNTKHICEVCGGKYSNTSKAKHFKTKKHLNASN